MIETWAGERPDDADAKLAPLLRPMVGVGYLVGADQVGKQLEAVGSKPGIASDTPELGSLVDEATEGERSWAMRKFDRAVEVLERVVEVAKKSPAAIAANTKLRDAFRLALVRLALSYQELGEQDKADAAMTEAVLSFRDKQMTSTTYGSAAYKLYTRISKALAAQGTGAIVVNIDDPNAIAFVDEVFAVGSGQVQFNNLLPGVYRVLVREGKAAGRFYEVEVKPGQTATVEVTWGFEQALHTSPEWVGFAYPDEKTRKKREAVDVATLEKMLGASGAVAVGIDHGKTERVRGSLYTATSTEPLNRHDVIVDEKQETELGEYLAQLRPTPPDQSGDSARVTASSSSRSPWLRRLAWGGVGAGALAISAGIGLIAIDGEGTCHVSGATCPRVWDTKLTGELTIAGGAAAAVSSGLYLYLTRGKGETKRSGVAGVSVSVDHDGAAFAIAGRF